MEKTKKINEIYAFIEDYYDYQKEKLMRSCVINDGKYVIEESECVTYGEAAMALKMRKDALIQAMNDYFTS